MKLYVGDSTTMATAFVSSLLLFASVNANGVPEQHQQQQVGTGRFLRTPAVVDSVPSESPASDSNRNLQTGFDPNAFGAVPPTPAPKPDPARADEPDAASKPETAESKPEQTKPVPAATPAAADTTSDFVPAAALFPDTTTVDGTTVTTSGTTVTGTTVEVVQEPAATATDPPIDTTQGGTQGGKDGAGESCIPFGTKPYTETVFTVVTYKNDLDFSQRSTVTALENGYKKAYDTAFPPGACAQGNAFRNVGLTFIVSSASSQANQTDDSPQQYLLGIQLRTNGARKYGIPYSSTLLYSAPGPLMGNLTAKPNSTECDCPGPKSGDVVKAYNEQLAISLQGIDQSGASSAADDKADETDAGDIDDSFFFCNFFLHFFNINTVEKLP